MGNDQNKAQNQNIMPMKKLNYNQLYGQHELVNLEGEIFVKKTYKKQQVQQFESIKKSYRLMKDSSVIKFIKGHENAQIYEAYFEYFEDNLMSKIYEKKYETFLEIQIINFLEQILSAFRIFEKNDLKIPILVPSKIAVKTDQYKFETFLISPEILHLPTTEALTQQNKKYMPSNTPMGRTEKGYYSIGMIGLELAVGIDGQKTIIQQLVSVCQFKSYQLYQILENMIINSNSNSSYENLIQMIKKRKNQILKQSKSQIITTQKNIVNFRRGFNCPQNLQIFNDLIPHQKLLNKSK